MKLLFASHNPNKTKEIQSFLGDAWQVKNLHDLGLTEEIPETGHTIEENANIKAQFLFDKYKIPCFADDSGLEVNALEGAPGVRSARYAGDQKDDQANMELLLENLQGQNNRAAQFKTVVSYIDANGETHPFTGIIKGNILLEKIGDSGFGYDPIFQPEGYDRSFAQMNMQEKNKISHRAKAVAQLVSFLKRNNK